MIDTRILEIIDENDKVVGKETRHEIHKNGLLHREIHVWLYNGEGELFFQKRANDKDTFPGLLDASVGGHVEVGDSYEETAVKEIKEETGLEIKSKDLKLIAKIRQVAEDKITNTVNNSIKYIYACRYDGPVGKLRVEKGKATGFEIVKINSLFKMTDTEKLRFIPNVFDKEILNIFRKIKENI